ncbi:hypothetical protein OGAPHI_001957 [Ogataea philodendri]|uniref:Uncharacterized protein n=1 Tax=Ogataea philodendri TaxID=1378263 RepID=A0A9P8P9R6_9ASCO|nr:uncharacterized protein OGAPHI_001957 [Ogataea philodendri]KAH3668203.1 hypothetical protein OGAPHI_001957 [Ogataea philodendri]
MNISLEAGFTKVMGNTNIMLQFANQKIERRSNILILGSFMSNQELEKFTCGVHTLIFHVAQKNKTSGLSNFQVDERSNVNRAHL